MQFQPAASANTAACGQCVLVGYLLELLCCDHDWGEAQQMLSLNTITVSTLGFYCLIGISRRCVNYFTSQCSEALLTAQIQDDKFI